MLLEITEGWTGVLGPFTLRVDDLPLDLTGMTVTLKLHNAAGAEVTPGGTITVLNQITNKGQLNYAPGASDFLFLSTGQYGPVQTYRIHWKVVDGTGKIVYFPSGAPDEIGVYRA